MKNSLEQKRSEWQIDSDVQQDWQQMHSLLDTHMPVANPVAGSGGSGAGGTLPGIGGIKLISVIIVALSAATVLYFTVKHNKTDKQKFKARTEKINPAFDHQKDSTIKPVVNRGNGSAVSVSDGRLADHSIGVNDKSSQGSGVNDKAALADHNDPANLNDQRSIDKATGQTVSQTKVPETGAVTKPVRGILSGVNGKGSGTNTEHSVGMNGATHVNGVNKPEANNTDKSLNAGNVHSLSAKLRNHVNPVSSIKNSSGTSARNTIGGINNRKHGSSGARLTGRFGSSVINGSAGVIPPGQITSKYSKSSRKGNLKNKDTADKQINKGTSNSKAGLINDGRNALNNNAIPSVVAADQPQYYGTAMDLFTPHLSDANNVIIVKPSAGQLKNSNIAIVPVPGKSTKNKTEPKLQLGILAGVNAPGSFTGSSENANVYGSLPVDVFLGLFVNYTVYKKWAFNLQPKLLSPQTVSGTYTHAIDTKVDSGKTLTMTDSRKIYFVDVPLHLVYKATPNISLMGGLAVSIPAKQVNVLSNYSTSGTKKDSVYYAKVKAQVNATQYNWQSSLGISGGMNFNYQRLFFNATYLKALKSQSITSDLGGYTFSHDALQLSVGFRLK